MKRQRNTTQIREQTGNTEVQINEESINKDREELKDKHTETNNIIAEI